MNFIESWYIYVLCVYNRITFSQHFLAFLFGLQYVSNVMQQFAVSLLFAAS